MIKFSNVKFKYYKDLILKGISFETPKNGIVSILGENGSGKSTLINQISNKANFSGEIKINFKSIKEYKSKELPKLISFLPQKITFPEETTVFDVMRIGRDPYTNMWGVLSKKDKKIIEKYAKVTGVSNLINKNFHNLSGGQQQRALLTMCLSQETKILLLDEPTNHLDVRYQVEFFKIIKELSKNKLIVITTHNINFAAKYSNKIAMIKSGKIIKYGDANIINKENIKNLFGINATIKKINNIPKIVDMEL